MKKLITNHSHVVPIMSDGISRVEESIADFLIHQAASDITYNREVKYWTVPEILEKTDVDMTDNGARKALEKLTQYYYPSIRKKSIENPPIGECKYRYRFKFNREQVIVNGYVVKDPEFAIDTLNRRHFSSVNTDMKESISIQRQLIHYMVQVIISDKQFSREEKNKAIEILKMVEFKTFEPSMNNYKGIIRIDHKKICGEIRLEELAMTSKYLVKDMHDWEHLFLLLRELDLHVMIANKYDFTYSYKVGINETDEWVRV